jgi:transcriptional regulator with XRE-family HTH domain
MERGRIHLNSELLRHLRMEHCWSQATLADICFEKGIRVSLSSIKRAEAGEKVLYRTALEFAKVYKIPVTQLLIRQHGIDRIAL